MSKYCRKTLAIVLTLCLVFTLAVPSFAEVGGVNLEKPVPTHTYQGSGEALNVVTIGDSQTNGYFMEGFFKKDEGNNFVMTPGKSDDILDSSGFNIYIGGTYPDLLAKHIADTTGRTVDLYQYAMSALRYEDLHKLLDSEARTDDFYKFWFSEKEQAGTQFDDPVNYFGKSYYDSENKPIGTYEQLHKNYTWAVQNADVLTFALGINYFGNYLASRLLAVISGDEDDAYAKMHMDSGAYLKLTESQKALYKKYYNKAYDLLLSMVGEKNQKTLEKVDFIVKDLVYSLTGFTTGYKNCLDDIYKLNPDVNLILIGMSNVTEGLVITFEEQGVPIHVDLGKIIGVLLDAGNLYIASEGAKSKLDTTYVSPGSFGKFIENIGQLDKNKAEFNNNVELLVQYNVQYFVKNFGKAVFGTELTSKMLKVKSGDGYKEESDKDYVLNMADIKSSVNGIQTSQTTADEDIGKVYLGLRDAIIYAANNTSKIDLLDALPVFTQDESAVKKLKETYEDQTGVTDLRTKVYNTFSQKGVSDFMYVCARILVHSAGSHINKAGHEAVAERVIAAYDKHAKLQKTKQALKKAVPVIVGGVAVTMIVSSVAKKIKNNSGQEVNGNKVVLTYVNSNEKTNDNSGLVYFFSNIINKAKTLASKILRTNLIAL